MTDEVADQAKEQSAEEKVLGHLGNLGLPAEEPAAEEAAPDLFDIEIDGETFSLPPKLKDAFLRNEDYTRKTQELADQRRSYDQLREVSTTRQMDSAFRESIGAESQEMNVIDAYLSEVSKANTSGMTTDQLIRWKMERDNVLERRSLLEKQIEGKRSRFNDDVKSKMTELRGKSRELASKSIPGFTEETEKAVRAYALSEGLTDQEFDNVILDSRSTKIVWKAMQFDKVQASATQAQGKVDKVLKVGAATERMPQAVKDKFAFGKAMKGAKTSGEKASVIEQRLEGIFAKRR
jgi:hypothetical protein